MNKVVKVHCEAGFVYLSEFSDIIDIAKVETYTVKHNKDKTIVIKFYDKNKKWIKPYERK